MQTPAQVRCAWCAAARTGNFGIRQPKEAGARSRRSRRTRVSGRRRRSPQRSRRRERTQAEGESDESVVRKADDAGVPTSTAQYRESRVGS